MTTDDVDIVLGVNTDVGINMVVTIVGTIDEFIVVTDGISVVNVIVGIVKTFSVEFIKSVIFIDMLGLNVLVIFIVGILVVFVMFIISVIFVMFMTADVLPFILVMVVEGVGSIAILVLCAVVSK